ncbi:nitrite reductase [Fulvivirgaceae bacterium BMA12]|uniref:Nitrite reductase n=1 Tax=Agaribacillus aureus TaxID=3051825 RepID=A0ABT8L547_9BACT|nr:nitrite reductase [Fulvivirgaceae bacterium BMA12]
MESKLSNKISTEAKEDIRELVEKIGRFHNGEIDEDKFKAYRLTRGVYGQRQVGVQMFRTKIPYGRLTSDQLIRIADVSEKYTNGNLHTTTRQNIQLHYVKLDDSPAIWTELEEVGVTAREACGNTVRNVTGSALAGIDPDEPFDITAYAEATFRYFLRNPICQDMGRKIKIAFSSSSKDSAFAYFHDFGFIPVVKTENGKEVRGFKTLIGGGLGAQSIVAKTAFEFLPEDQIIPFTEAAIRVFDRYGEREKRFKARMKFLIDEKRGLGFEKFMELVEKERKSIPHQSYPIDRTLVPELVLPPKQDYPEVAIADEEKYQDWLTSNVFEQKQKGFHGVQIKLSNGNIDAERARKLSAIIKKYAGDDLRITVNQGFLLKYVETKALPVVFNELNALGLAEYGFGTIADITACPGTDTCNLGVSNSTGVAEVLEGIIKEEYKDLIFDADIQIKISGCMNSCGQHMAANIGFHGSSIKNGKLVVPALVVLLGGGVDPEGQGSVGDKVAKLPSKKAPEALRIILDDYKENALPGEYFNSYYRRYGKIYFFDLLKHLIDPNQFIQSDYIDWGATDNFVPAIGVGECAGVSYDVIGTIIDDASEKLSIAKKELTRNEFARVIYNAYNTLVIGAKGLLLSEDVSCNTHIGILRDFDKHFVSTNKFPLEGNFETLVLQINENEPGSDFAIAYLEQAEQFLQDVKAYRARQVAEDTSQKGKLVVDNFYKA